LIAAAGLTAAGIADQDARVPFASYVALMRAAKAMSGDPALALHYGEMIDISEVSLVGLIGQASETMAEAFVQTNRYVRLIVDPPLAGERRFELKLDARGLWMVDLRQDPNAFPELSESAFAQIVSAPRRANAAQVAREVHFTHRDPGYADEYERVLGAPVVFDSDRNALLLDPSTQNRPVAQLPRYAFGILSERAEALMRSLETITTVRGRVEAELANILHTGEIGMDKIARRLGMSRQTLYRRLRAEGLTFEKTLDALRHRLALDYLAGRKVSVNETAYLVGFSDPAAFSRAFKRWTGKSPRDMRGGETPRG
jgi:AraC-like DNA-binding protein